MPLPLLALLALGGTGAFGLGKGARALYRNSEAKDVNYIAQKTIDKAVKSANVAREQSNLALENLGKTKIRVLDSTVSSYLDYFELIGNIEFDDFTVRTDTANFTVSKSDIAAISHISSLASSVASGIAGGAVGGALTAFGAYGATMAFASASTGTAIASLTGVAATNATLAFLGGGAIAAGGGGIAAGMTVLGGAVAAPAVAILGIFMDAKAGKNLDNAYTNLAKAEKYSEEIKTATLLCDAIRTRADMFTALLDNLDDVLKKFVADLKTTIKTYGTDYSAFSSEDKSRISMSMSVLTSIKSVMDTPLLDSTGKLTEESQNLIDEYASVVDEVEEEEVIVNEPEFKTYAQLDHTCTSNSIDMTAKAFATTMSMAHALLFETVKFKMEAEHVFDLSGRGTAVVGIVEKGSIKLGETVTVNRNDGKSYETTVLHIETYGKLLDRAEAGQKVYLFLKDVTSDNISVGNTIFKK